MVVALANVGLAMMSGEGLGEASTVIKEGTGVSAGTVRVIRSKLIAIHNEPIQSKS
jgi:hypothetical protein